MRNLTNRLMKGLIAVLIVSCSNLESSPNPSSITPVNEETPTQIQEPKIPFSNQMAFYQLRRRADGKILPSYQWRECVKKFIICTKWEAKTVYFEDLEWFLHNEFGLIKRPKP